jgi:hypothetical protein
MGKLRRLPGNLSSLGSIESAERVEVPIEMLDQAIAVHNVEMYHVAGDGA